MLNKLTLEADPYLWHIWYDKLIKFSRVSAIHSTGPQHAFSFLYANVSVPVPRKRRYSEQTKRYLQPYSVVDRLARSFKAPLSSKKKVVGRVWLGIENSFIWLI